MNFTQISIKPEYRSLRDDIVNEFYIPMLENSILYKRAVGFFSSSALIEISRGITGLIKNGGKIQLIASPRLSDEDIEAINKGFELRDKVIEKSLLSSLLLPKNIFEEKRLNLLANLIINDQLDIKIAFTDSNNGFGIFHEKMGLMYDNENNVVAFTGSMNETSTAFSQNYESIDVFCSWENESYRVITKEKAFSNMWNDLEDSIKVIEFPKVVKEMFQKYKTTSELDLNIDYEEYEKERKLLTEKNSIKPTIPEDVKLYDYQLQAISNWEDANFKGIFDMATGTGKTYTGLAASVRLYEKLNGNLAVVIVCPYQHLVEQWVEDIEKFNIKPIIAYSSSSQTNWKRRLKDCVINFNLGIKQYFCMVTTNATFSSDYVQKEIRKIKGNLLLIVDEAHNFGAECLSKCLNPKIPYRLALSATLERHNDEEGTRKLFDYFGEKKIEYSLERAINENKLTPYLYYPVVVNFNNEELEKYQTLTRKIYKMCKFKSNGKVEMSKSAEILLIERARVIASASQKVIKLKQIMFDYKKDNHILVYCGAATIKDSTYSEDNIDEFEIRQIDAVSKMLGLELDMNISKFTSQEGAKERELLKKEFAAGEHLQALVAIRCLDEGVNIPNIKTAFILASSTNPKEYIQRRGRVLRKAEGKSKAVIYDFVTLPRPVEEVYSICVEDLRIDISLVKRELARMKDFARIAENSSVADSLIDELKEAYKLEFIGGIEDEF